MTNNRNPTRRRFLEATGGAATALALAGCITEDEEPEDTEEPTDAPTDTPTDTPEGDENIEQSDKVYKSINSTMTTLDPVASTDTASGTIIQNVFDGLTNYPNGETNVEMLLAEDYQSENNGSTLTFTLKQGATFSDGREVTADDVVYSFERLAASEHSRRADFILNDLGVTHETETKTDGEGEEYEAYVPGSMGVTADDDYTVRFELDSPFHASLEMLAYSSFSVVPEGILGDVEGYDGEMSYGEFSKENPIGAGPFTLADWSTEDQAEIDARPKDEYHGYGPLIAGAHYNIMEDPNARYTYSVLNRNADGPVIPNSKYDPNKIEIEGTDNKGREYGSYGPLENGLTAQYYRLATVSTYYVGFNQQNVDKPARQAWMYAWNPHEIANDVYKRPHTPAYAFTPPSIFPGGATEYESFVKENYPYGYNETDLESAREIMEEAGYSDSNKYEFTITTYESETAQDAASLMRDKLASAYIQLNVEQAPFSTLLERGRSGDLEAFTLGWIMDYPAPDNFLKLLYPPNTDTSKEGSASYTDWRGTEAAQRAEDAWETFKDNPAPTNSDKEARNEAYKEMEKANWEDAVFANQIHAVDEGYRYQWVDAPRHGAAGPSRAKLNKHQIGERE